MVLRQGLLVVAIAMIIIGAIVWGVSGHLPEGVYAASVAGQVIFWIGIVLIIIWAALYAYDSARTK